MNKYCGEHLIVANEIPTSEPSIQTHRTRSTLQLPHPEDDYSENELGQDEPVAEALIQNDQILHHVKIIKSSPSDTADASQDVNNDLEKENRKRQRVFSKVKH